MKNLLKVVFVLTIAAGLTACHKNVKDTAANADANGETEMVLTDAEVATANMMIPTQEVTLGTVHFALDKYDLSDEARKIVEANVKAIKAAAKAVDAYQVTIEGNCDDRGTTSYNIALGQKRADEVKAYYVRLGIPANKIETVSYGEEKPVCYESTQDCWSKNRRADTLLSAI